MTFYCVVPLLFFQSFPLSLDSQGNFYLMVSSRVVQSSNYVQQGNTKSRGEVSHKGSIHTPVSFKYQTCSLNSSAH